MQRAMGHHFHVTQAQQLQLDVVRIERAGVWLDDLRWHQHVYQRARFRWWGDHVMKIVTSRTGGQLDFTTVADLERLHRYQSEHAEYTFQCQIAMAEPLTAALETLGSWDDVGKPIGLSVMECRSTVGLALREPPEARTNPDVERILRMVRGQVFQNPLILAWELKQMWRMHDAVVDVFEDTICDLVDELRDSRPDEVLAQAVGCALPKGLDTRLACAHEVRGKAGDPRRIPTQLF
jgi:hypothetical protein